ncbi:creatininase family protein [Pseudonocardia sp. TRM90224]|uniref:creatininase family protein n=1 Tax=Pseudonocardia sp. TRM90224 TaxID=2812678 RepID=UPI001E2E6747|nr:creatininase family protein [Pseudonocardia sp. TRM90224]
MALYFWEELTREQLRAVLPNALVVLPVGATEQHGPHLPTGTDAIIVSEVVRAAARTADTTLDLVLAPPLPFGASDHHLPFGGTLSLRVETMTEVLFDLARSVHVDGASRLLLVNGHGGNRGACHSAAQRAATAYGMRIAYADYWELLRADRPAAADDPPVPGHAGAFESGLVVRLRPHLVGDLPERTPPDVLGVRGVTVQEQDAWTRTDGFSDNPAAAVDGGEWFDACVAALAARLVVLAAG